MRFMAAPIYGEQGWNASPVGTRRRAARTVARGRECYGRPTISLSCRRASWRRWATPAKALRMT